MPRRRLGPTGPEVSLIGLGTMTWGEQNSEAEAHAQLDMALAAGVNFIDTAELYPVPPKGETQGRTEEYIGSWLAQRGGREKLLIAGKAAARADWLPYLRGGKNRLDLPNLRLAVEDSLRRLRTDYFDLYQVHWPERKTNYFGSLGYEHAEGNDGVPIRETLHALQELVGEGKIRYIGVSNETPWGLLEYLRCAELEGLPRIVSIQNPYNLLNRAFEIGLAEIAHREQVGLLAYSPLGFGVLSGKYLNGNRPAGARLTLFTRFERYLGERAERAVAAYVELARRYGLDPAQMALAYVNSRSFVTSNLVGATSVEQLRSNLESARLSLPDEVLTEIERIHVGDSNPCP